MVSKKQFDEIWKDSSRESILNQFYYDYLYKEKLKQTLNKAKQSILVSRYFDKESCYEEFKCLKEVYEILKEMDYEE